jgi:hypothetical protein
MPMQALRYDKQYASLAERHEKLRRSSQAMWQLLKSKLNLSDQELRYALARIEQTARHEPRLLDCSVCRHPIQSSAKCCLFCGTTLNAAPDAATDAASHGEPRVTRLVGAWRVQQDA